MNENEGMYWTFCHIQTTKRDIFDKIKKILKKEDKLEKVLEAIEDNFFEFQRVIRMKLNKDDRIKKCYAVEYIFKSKKNQIWSDKSVELIEATSLLQAKEIMEEKPRKEWNNVEDLRIYAIRQCADEIEFSAL